MTDLRADVERVRDDLQALADHCRRMVDAADGDYTRGLDDGGALAYQTAAQRLTGLLEQPEPGSEPEQYDSTGHPEDGPQPDGEEPQRFDPMQWKNHTPPKVGTPMTLVRTPQWGDYL